MIDNQTAELLPCPFCGGEAQMGVNKESTVREYFIGCMNCHIRLYKIGYKRFWSEAEAIAAWNTRSDYDVQALKTLIYDLFDREKYFNPSRYGINVLAEKARNLGINVNID